MNHLRLAVFIVLLIGINGTIVTFYVDHEVERRLDEVCISAIVKTKSESL
jgi:hypothetical protein